MAYFQQSPTCTRDNNLVAWFTQTNGTLVFMLACGIDFVMELNAFRLVSILRILMYPFIFMKYLKIGHYRSTCLDYSELLAYFALIMMLISKYGFCRSSVQNYANHYDGVPDPNTLLCNFQSCHVSRLRCRSPAMCLSLKNNFEHPILLLSYGPVKNITNHYETFFHLFVMNSLVFLNRTFLYVRATIHIASRRVPGSLTFRLYSAVRTLLLLRYFKRTNLLFRLLWCLLHFQDIQYLSALFF